MVHLCLQPGHLVRRRPPHQHRRPPRHGRSEYAGKRRDAATLAYWHVLGLWKVAIIAEGIIRRVLDNPANRATGGTPITAWVDALVAKAREVAAQAGV